MDIKMYELATKMLQHKAKTKLVYLTTYLPESVIKDIYRRLHGEMPKQGLSPTDAKIFFKNNNMRRESNYLASLFSLDELTENNNELLDHEVAFKFLNAYESYLKYSKKQTIDVNRAWLMMLKLQEGELTFTYCSHCKTQYLEHYDIINNHTKECVYCEKLEQRHSEEMQRKSESNVSAA